ncbi:MAG: thioesterase [Flavobacteriales bacterium 32-35-8]|nr:MAG: thioesterase [Flavobacteriales bacterium 32-35-8]
MTITPSKLNTFTMFKLPSAYLCGVRARHIDNGKCVVTVRHRWMNQNPFKSMFWAVQGMAAEFSTGALMMMKIQESSKSISMLVVKNESTFSKKATGLITFVCHDGSLIDEAIKKAIETGEGQTLWMTSVGTNEEDQEVSTFKFQWSIKLKS